MKKLQIGARTKLEAIAKLLPVMEETVPNYQVKIRGSILIDKGITSIKIDNKDHKVKMYNWYRYTTNKKLTDHYKNLRKLYMKSNSHEEGMKKAGQYMIQVNKKYQETVK